MKSWLTRCESVCCPDTDLLCSDKVKLRNERLNVQVIFFSLNISFVFSCNFLLIIYCCIIFPLLTNCAGNAERDAGLRCPAPGS